MNTSPTPLRGRLAYIHLGSPDPGHLARFYAEVFGMTTEDRAGVWICRAPNCCLVLSTGESNTLLSAGYTAASAEMLQHLSERVVRSIVPCTAVDTTLFEPSAIAFRDPDGNRIVYGLPSTLAITEPMGAPSVRLQHVVVGSTNVPRMVEFYTKIVGLRESDEVKDEAGTLRTCFMRSDDEHHSFAVFQTSTNRLDHHCYELPDWNAIRDWGDRLAALRIPVKWGPGRHGPGNNLFLFFHDPDGNWVELSAELEVVAPERPVGIWPHEERTLNLWGRGYLRS